MKKCDILNAKNYDTIIIGFGKGGKTLAGFLGSKGKKVALVERDKNMYGGTCINIGCIPTKILVEESQKVEKDFKKAIERKNTLISKLREANYNKLDSFENMDIYTGVGSFKTEHIISVTSGEEEKVLRGEQIFINTGSKTVIPKIEGLEKTRNIYTSTSIMELNELPKRLAIIGGGYIGLEFASIYNNFGSKVTIFEGGDDILLREEPEIRKEVRKDLQNRGVEVLTKSNIIKVSNYSENEVEVSFSKNGKNETLIFDGVLIAVGRKPNINDLKLENAGVGYSDRGILVNENLQTNVPHIYALGDVKGGLQFTYISLDDFRIIKNNLFGDKTLTVSSRALIPYSVFISPTLSKVGMSEKEALDAGYKVKVKVVKVASIPRAKILEEERGVLKAVIDESSGRILGCSLYSVESSEVINIVTMAIKENKKYSYLRDFIFTHPTMSEALNDLFDF
ncbi:FAD-dependent oxidoreductase [Cetobacterium somerae]|uniref:FAD-dependent oxidoreductase n=1 Tax=Cetobacterium somerae TaxID=188913 RepID=UPI00211F3C4D|nr:FAD-dependent oxidoreductase [Cetobacterium somerae]MCQ9627180.1 FAD-dependent oxidoreductase [Cetobacterium somerae]